MDHANPAERALFSDLTRLFMATKDAPQAQVEAMIEERFRAFVRAHPDCEVDTLQITLSWTLPDGADDWAIYRTDYKTLPADVAQERRRALAGAPADVVELASAHISRSMAPTSGPALIIPFPGR
jgi:hypothetical protein